MKRNAPECWRRAYGNSSSDFLAFALLWPNSWWNRDRLGL